MQRNLHVVSLIFLIILCSLGCKNSLPNDIEKRIYGEWVIRPNIHSKTFNIYKFDEIKHDKCSVFRFSTPKELFWAYVDKGDTLTGLLCGNALNPSYESTWYFEGNSIVLDKVWSATQEQKREKLKYTIYELSPDTFTFVFDDTLLVEHKKGFRGR